MRRVDIDTRSSLEDLNDGLAARDFEDLSTANGSVGEGELNDLLSRDGQLRC